jgi:hypothetical protein
LVYVGGVEYWARPRDTPVAGALADTLLTRLRREFGAGRAWLHPGGRDVILALSLTDIADALNGDDASLQRVAQCVSEARGDGMIDGVTIAAEISNPQGEPSIVVHLRVRIAV